MVFVVLVGCVMLSWFVFRSRGFVCLVAVGYGLFGLYL